MSLWQLEWQTLPVIRPPKGGGEVQPDTGCTSMEQVTLMNTFSPLTFRNQRSLKLSVDYYCITAPFFSAPCLPRQSTPPASSFERFFSLQLAHPPFAFTFSSSPLLLVTVWIKVFRVMTAVGRLQWLKDKDVIIQDVCFGWGIKK